MPINIIFQNKDYILEICEAGTDAIMRAKRNLEHALLSYNENFILTIHETVSLQ